MSKNKTLCIGSFQSSFETKFTRNFGRKVQNGSKNFGVQLKAELVTRVRGDEGFYREEVSKVGGPLMK